MQREPRSRGLQPACFGFATLRLTSTLQLFQSLGMKLETAIGQELNRLTETKTFKKETEIESEQGAVVRVAGKDVVMLASNNYLGFSSHPRIKQAAIRGVQEYGHGVSSVRFLCGTLTIHRQLEEKIAAFVGTEDSILFSSCFTANEGFFASIVNEKLGHDTYRDVIYSRSEERRVGKECRPRRKRQRYEI